MDTISVSQANSCVSAPIPKRDCSEEYPRKSAILILAMKQRKTIGTTSPCMTPRLLSASQLKSIQSYNRAAQEMIRVIPEDRSTHAWMTASCKEWDTFRLSDSRVYQTYGTKESRKEGRSSKAIDLAKLHTRWERLLQFIHEEMWNDRQRCLPMGRARADSRAHILKELGLFEGGPVTGGGMATRHRVDQR